MDDSARFVITHLGDKVKFIFDLAIPFFLPQMAPHDDLDGQLSSKMRRSKVRSEIAPC